MSIMNVVEQFFHEDDWKYDDSHRNDEILSTGINAENGSFKLHYLCDEKGQTLRVIAMLNTNIPEAKRGTVAEFIVRCNYIYKMGHLDMDFSDGEVRFVWGIDVEGGELTSQMVKRMTYIAFASIDDVQPYLMKICYGDMTPEDAYKQWREN
ncbi:MAG: YbjN domain-containing protein [Thermoguttaceae bacterium]|nr:YbjN domain-containing protein [Thermoguttaceae bacterium]